MFEQENNHLARFFVIDCKDSAKYDPESQPFFTECQEENLNNLPQVTYFVSPSNKIHQKSNKLLPLIKFDHKSTYDLISLRNRLIEIQPSYSFIVKDDASLKDFESVGAGQKNIPRVIYFNSKPERSLEFKLITQRFRHQAIFAEAFPSIDQKSILGSTQEEIEMPFIVVKRLGDNSVNDLEIHTKSDSFEEMKESIEKSLDKQEKTM